MRSRDQVPTEKLQVRMKRVTCLIPKKVIEDSLGDHPARTRIHRRLKEADFDLSLPFSQCRDPFTGDIHCVQERVDDIQLQPADYGVS